MKRILLSLILGFCTPVFAQVSTDIVFVTQPPLPRDFGTVNATFANHRASVDISTRGGDLYIRYADGTLRNLTRAAGFGMDGFQTASAISVRDPAVHWDAKKIIFSMVIGASPQQYLYSEHRWQLYEITNFGKNETPQIKKVANQPAEYNNVMPVYGSDDQIIFVSDRPHNGQSHLYPQRDEYESTATNTGLWKLNADTGALVLLDHAPSGDFHPTIDSFGRVIFSRWDHLQRDQQKDAGGYGTFNYSDESAEATLLAADTEVFPESRSASDPDRKSFEELHTINQFFPWMINQDGTEVETLNHVGRHELSGYFNRSFNTDDALNEFTPSNGRNSAENFFNIREDPTSPGTFFAVEAPEFGTHTAGGIISINGGRGVNPDSMTVKHVTHPATTSVTSTPTGDHTGLYRNPLPLSNGTLVAVHTTETREDTNTGTREQPGSRYAFRLKVLTKQGDYYVPGSTLTPGIPANVSFWDPDAMVSYAGVNFWELQPVEVVARARPETHTGTLENPELQIFQEAGVSPSDFRAYLADNNLALVVSRNVTTRDKGDKQQPFNLRVAGTSTESKTAEGALYDISHLQFFQGDLIRGYGGVSDPDAGRRVLAAIMHSDGGRNPGDEGGPAGSVKIGADGSMAAFVPARRALSWQLTAPDGSAVVRERYWLTFQPGEIRLCASCHGVNTKDQLNRAAPSNPPQALKALLEHWKQLPHDTRSYSLRISGGKARNGAVQLPAGKRFGFAIDGQGSGASGRQLELRVLINGKQCTTSALSFTTDGNGDYSGNLKAPSSNRPVTVTLQLAEGSNVLASARSKIARSKKKVAKRKTSHLALCRGLSARK
jgi:hypothetical protein